MQKRQPFTRHSRLAGITGKQLRQVALATGSLDETTTS